MTEDSERFIDHLTQSYDDMSGFDTDKGDVLKDFVLRFLRLNDRQQEEIMSVFQEASK